MSTWDDAAAAALGPTPIVISMASSTPGHPDPATQVIRAMLLEDSPYLLGGLFVGNIGGGGPPAGGERRADGVGGPGRSPFFEHEGRGESWPTAAIPMGGPYCSCKLRWSLTLF